MFNGANLYLIVNFVIAMSFAGVFFAVSRRSRSRAAARWIGLGFAVASLSVPAELVIAYTPFVRPGAAVAFAAVLAGLLLIRMGVGSLYNVTTRPAPLAIFLVVCTAIVIAIYDQPRSTLSHSIPYQTPFAISCLLSAAAIAFSSHRAPVDRWMMFVFSLTGAHFFLKAYLAAAVGAGRVASDYLFSNYAVISQSLTAVLMVMTGQPPASETATTASAAGARLAVLGAYLGRGLFQDLGFGGEDRLEISAGERISRDGRETYEFEYRLGGRWSLQGEYDQFDSYNAGLKWRAYTEESEPDEKK